MIYKEGKEIEKIVKNDIVIGYIYKGITLIWEYIKSCFGKGFWINEKIWSNLDTWKNK